MQALSRCLSTERRVALAIGGSALVCLFLILRSWRYADTVSAADLGRFNALCTAIAAIGSVFAFAVLLVYTRETYVLRKTAERQLRGSYRPMLVLTIESFSSRLAFQVTSIRLRNVGTGPALNVSISPIQTDDFTLTFTPKGAACIGPGGDVEVGFLIQMGGGTHRNDFGRLASLCRGNMFPPEVEVVIEAQFIDGREHRGRHTITWNASPPSLESALIPSIID